MQDTKTTPKNTLPITWIVVSILTMILLGAGVILMREIFPLQKASIAYNEAIVGYNANADTYNFLLKNTSIDNLDGFPIAADKLSSVDTTLSSVIRSFSNGNSAKKTQMDIRTIADLSDYLTENIRILEQITAPSEAWVAERLQNVDDILEIQAVTPDNDPNGLLNKEDGGYTACIYLRASMWMETLLYPKEQTEVVQSRYMAHWRTLKLVVSTCTVLIIRFCILAPMQLLAQWSFESLIFIQLKNNMR